MQQKSKWIPWVVGGVIVAILVIFSLIGGIGAVVDDTSRQDAAVDSAAPAQGGGTPPIEQ